jgi:hypothetical protein
MINGFFNIDSFINNSTNATNPIGEISAKGLTYERDVKQYVGVKGTLLQFGISNSTVYIDSNIQAIGANVVTLLDNLVNVTTPSGSLLADITSSLGNTVSAITIGEATLNPVDNKLYPNWITFTVLIEGNSIDLKIWLSNEVFLTEYPLGYIKLIYPIADIQTLYDDYLTNRTTVQALTPSSLIKITHDAITYPVTGFDSLSVRVYNRLNTAQYFNLPIAVAYNGGSIYCNKTSFMETFKNELLSGGIIPLEDWLVVIPSLVPLNKYYIVPNWANTALPNQLVVSPICSPTIAIESVDIVANAHFSQYNVADVVGYLDYSVAIYKSIGFFVLPDIGNSDGRIRWRAKFSDYFILPLTDLNIGQMSPRTKTVSIALDQLLHLAETYTVGDTLPAGFKVEVYATKTYITKSVETILLLVSPRIPVI